MNTYYRLQNLVNLGVATLDVRDVRGWSPWHQHGLTAGKATYVTPRDRDAFIQTLKHCHENGLDYTLIGGGTATFKPSETDLVISTECLNALSIDTAADILVFIHKNMLKPGLIVAADILALLQHPDGF